VRGASEGGPKLGDGEGAISDAPRRAGNPLRLFIAKVRRLADALEDGREFRIQVAGQRVRIPADVMISVEHERGAQLRGKR